MLAAVVDEPIRNQRAPMQYRRFGSGGPMLSVITLGGMRYDHGWESPRYELPERSVEQCRDCTARALELGINHIETAWGYGKSEHLYGRVLNQELSVPRSRYHLMTKARAATAQKQLETVQAQLRALQTEHIDLYAWHGLNSLADLDTACALGGPVEALHTLQRQGVIGKVGFSTHAPLPVLMRALDTGMFQFVNLHYYYFRQRNEAAVRRAEQLGMGVFIISPNDKGGRLFRPPPLLTQLTAPLTPIQWNARFCLRTPAVHTLSFGMTEPAHFDEMRGVLPASTPLLEQDVAILARMDAQLARVPHGDYEGWELEHDPSGINVPEVLRLRRMLLGWDMEHYGRYRYNMFGTGDSWYPGQKCTEEHLARIDRASLPRDLDLLELLRETHARLDRPRETPETGH
jgi:predicted aldo/keto reductase-like oxidoreductase